MLFLLFVLLAASATAAPTPPLKTRNVFLIVTDGFRWQEVFTGAEEDLIDKISGGVKNLEALRHDFWRPTPEARRQALLPFIWSEVAVRGQLFGNQNKGSVVRVANQRRSSYPGYNEMLTGSADPSIESNKKIPNPNVTVFEWLQTRRGFAKRVAVFGTWDVFPSILNVARSKIPIWPSWDKTTPAILPSPAVAQLMRDTTPLWDDMILDSFLQIMAVDYIKKKHPRLLFLGYGETDEWAHEGRSDRDQTTFIVTADHGRGRGLSDWKTHGANTVASEDTWFAILGPDTPPLGERTSPPPATLSQTAATIAQLLGEDYHAAFPQATLSLPSAIQPE